jgi:hypothetical protein
MPISPADHRRGFRGGGAFYGGGDGCMQYSEATRAPSEVVTEQRGGRGRRWSIVIGNDDGYTYSFDHTSSLFKILSSKS